MQTKNQNETKSGLHRLSGDFNRGYTKAIQDMMEIFEYIQSDLAYHHKRLNAKTLKELVKCFLDNREKLRDEWNGFIRYNGITKSFEFFNSDEKDKSNDTL